MEIKVLIGVGFLQTVIEVLPSSLILIRVSRNGNLLSSSTSDLNLILGSIWFEMFCKFINVIWEDLCHSVIYVSKSKRWRISSC